MTVPVHLRLFQVLTKTVLATNPLSVLGQVSRNLFALKAQLGDYDPGAIGEVYPLDTKLMVPPKFSRPPGSRRALALALTFQVNRRRKVILNLLAVQIWLFTFPPFYIA